MIREQWLKCILLVFVVLLLAACGRSDDSQSSDETGQEEIVTSNEVAEAEQSESTEPVSVAEGMRVFTIVPEESSASYVVQEEFFAGALSKLGIDAGNVEVTGTTPDVTGQLQLDLGSENPLGDNQFAVNLSTFSTDQNRRDNWIRDEGPQFGSAPPAQFVATSIDNAPGDYTEGEEVSFTLNGDLTIKEVTNPVSFDVTATLSGDTITGTASTQSKLTDWNIEPPNFANTLTVADELEIRLNFKAKE